MSPLLYFADLAAKPLELLHEFAPQAAVDGMLLNPNLPDGGSQWKDAARLLGQQVHAVYEARAISAGRLRP
jgi:hypothetical protein